MPKPAQESARSEAADAPRPRHWGRQLGAVTFLLAVLGAAGWYGWSHWVVVPDLVGRNRAEAAAILDGEGLRVGSIVTTYAGDEGQYATGTVLAHTPPAGGRTSPRGGVVLTVVGGPEWTTMCDLRSLTVTEAAARLACNDATISVVDPVYHAVPLAAYTHGPGLRVSATTPRPGKRLERGGAVMLAVERPIEATERRWVFGHPGTILAEGIEGCYAGCHKELECAKCHLKVLSGRVVPDGVSVEEIVRDAALSAAGAITDEKAPRLVRVASDGGGAFTVTLNADAPKPGPEVRSRMLAATAEYFKEVLGRVGIEQVTVVWVRKGTTEPVMRVRMTADTMWRQKWTGLPGDQLPELADSFSE